MTEAYAEVVVEDRAPPRRAEHVTRGPFARETFAWASVALATAAFLLTAAGVAQAAEQTIVHCPAPYHVTGRATTHTVGPAVATQAVLTPDCLLSRPTLTPTTTQTTTAPAGPRISSTVMVTVTILPTVLVRLNNHGDPTQATTNAGCPPRGGDRFSVVIGDGVPRPATNDLISRVLAMRLRGDWTVPGVWHALA